MECHSQLTTPDTNTSMYKLLKEFHIFGKMKYKNIYIHLSFCSLSCIHSLHVTISTKGTSLRSCIASHSSCLFSNVLFYSEFFLIFTPTIPLKYFISLIKFLSLLKYKIHIYAQEGVISAKAGKARVRKSLSLPLFYSNPL